jgi:CHAT domain-containing protein/Tfp pilus assembly protein PilF
MKRSGLNWVVVGLLIATFSLALFPRSGITAPSLQGPEPRRPTDEALIEKSALSHKDHAEVSFTLLTPTPTPITASAPPLAEDLQPIPAYSPQAEALREATLLLGEGDRLSEAGHIEEAREKWLAAAAAYQEAGDGLGEADAYLRLADSYNYSLEAILEAILHPQKFRLAMDYYQKALIAATDVYETLIQKELTYDQETLDKAQAFYEQGLEQYEAGHCDQALPLLDEARQLYHSIDFGAGEIRALVIIARCQLETGDFLNALLNILNALQIANDLPLGTPTTELYLQGRDQYERGDWPAAEESFQKARDQYQQAGNLVGVAQVTLDLGNVYAVQGNFPQAEELYEQALPMFIAQADQYNEAATYHNLANLAVLTGRYDEAVEGYHSAIHFWQALGKPIEEVVSASGLGLALRAQGHYTEALTTLQGAMALQQHLSPDPETEGDLLNNIGMVYYGRGHYQQALDCFQQALDLRRELPHRQKEAESLSNIASVQASLGRFDEALSGYQQVLELATQSGLTTLAAAVRVNIAGVHAQQGDYQAAIATYVQALPAFTENQDLPGQAGILLNIGVVYFLVGNRAEASNQLNQALHIYREIGNLEGVATAKSNLGILTAQGGDLMQAEVYLRQALATWRDLDNPVAASRTLGDLAIVTANRGDPQAALEQGREALRLSEQAGNQADTGRLLIIVGTVNLALDNYATAIEYGQQAVNLANQIGDPATEMGGHLLLGTSYYAQEKYAQAYEHVKAAVGLLEMLQGAITIDELKITFLGNLADVYDLAVLTAVELGRPEEAFQYAEQARARAFLDQLANGQVDFRAGADTALLAREQGLRAEIAARRAQFISLRSRSSNEWDMEAINTAQAELAALEETYTTLIRALKLESPETASLVSPEAASLAEVQSLLDPYTTLIEYFVADERTLAFIITHDTFGMVVLDVRHEELANTLTTFRDFASLEDPHPASLQQLYQWLIAPLQSQLDTPALGIVPHSVLHYLPFAALTDGERYLSDDYALFTLPSASTLRFIQEKRKPRADTLLALGNPITAEPLPVLRFAEQEVGAIAALYGVQPLVGAEATESAVWSGAGNAGVLHLAAHGEYNPFNPLFSAIHMAGDAQYDGRLEVHEIYGLDLTAATDLVVLSACQTQVGRLSAGDEVVGLNRAFLYSGTPSVIASLWSVDDESTALLMERFYTYLRAGTGKAEALRQAQADLRREYPHPYYWAAFVLTGDAGEVTGEALIPAATPVAVSTLMITPLATLPDSTDMHVSTTTPSEVKDSASQEPTPARSERRLCVSTILPLGVVILVGIHRKRTPQMQN